MRVFWRAGRVSTTTHLARFAKHAVGPHDVLAIAPLQQSQLLKRKREKTGESLAVRVRTPPAQWCQFRCPFGRRPREPLRAIGFHASSAPRIMACPPPHALRVSWARPPAAGAPHLFEVRRHLVGAPRQDLARAGPRVRGGRAGRAVHAAVAPLPQQLVEREVERRYPVLGGALARRAPRTRAPAVLAARPDRPAQARVRLRLRHRHRRSDASVERCWWVRRQC